MKLPIQKTRSKGQAAPARNGLPRNLLPNLVGPSFAGGGMLNGLLGPRVESLEYRLLWSVAQDPNGWTVVSNPGAKIIYVSSSAGSDSNSGTSMSSPVKSFAKAQSLSTSGANEILLKSGDVFTDSFQNWSLSGQSLQAPFLVSYYNPGTIPAPLPLIYTGTAGTGFSTGSYGSSGATVNYLDVIGLQFDANLRDPTLGTVNTGFSGEDKGFEFYANGTGILVEDCSFNYYGGDNIDVEAVAGSGSKAALYPNPSITNFTIRRSVVDNAYGFYGGKAQGLYAYGVNGFSVLQSTFDHNGWNTNLYLGAQDIGFNHNMYFASTCSNIVVQQNVIAEASYAGVMARAGGDIDYNLFIGNAVAVSFGAADGADSTVGGVSGHLIGNVIVGDRASQTITYNSKTGSYQMGAGLAFGQGFVIANTAPEAGVVVQYNVFTQDTQNAKPAITLTMATNTHNRAFAVGINNLTISNNVIYNTGAAGTGWRQAISTDGRFVPGGTGLYALNGLTISHNDFVNDTTQEVRHDGGFAVASESWTGDRYYDTVLSQSKWVTLQSKNVSFATWSSIYDVGATALTRLTYADPTRSVATYDTTAGGPGSWQDFLTQSDQLSINNYRPVYMSQAAVSYVDAGFNIISGGGSISGGGGGGTVGVVSATSTALGVNTNALGATTYTFTVNYVDQFQLNTAALNSSNILVTGPNGFSQLATYVSVASPYYTDANFYNHWVATYRITAPNGAWASGKGEDGTYSITLLPNQPLDSSGTAAQDGVIGTFVADLTPPVAVAVATSINSANTFTVTYSDSSGIDLTSLNSYEVQITGSNNYSQYATLVSDSASANGDTVVCTYTITLPAATGIYNISMIAASVSDVYGNPVPAGVLATFAVGTSTTNTASISGTVFNDANGNGVLDSRELPFFGVRVFIDYAGTGNYDPNVDTAMVTTDANGNYTFSGLAAGRYTIVAIPPTGYSPTSPSTGFTAVTLTTGQVATGINFGDQLGSAVVNSTDPNSKGSRGTTLGSAGTGTVITRLVSAADS